MALNGTILTWDCEVPTNIDAPLTPLKFVLKNTINYKNYFITSVRSNKATGYSTDSAQFSLAASRRTYGNGVYTDHYSLDISLILRGGPNAIYISRVVPNTTYYKQTAASLIVSDTIINLPSFTAEFTNDEKSIIVNLADVLPVAVWDKFALDNVKLQFTVAYGTQKYYQTLNSNTTTVVLDYYDDIPISGYGVLTISLGFNSSYSSASYYNLPSNKTLTHTQTYNMYQKITFNANGGSWVEEIDNEYVESSYEIHMATNGICSSTPDTSNLQRNKYEFKGWSLTSSGSQSLIDFATYKFTKDTEVYAVWQELAPLAKVTFNANGGAWPYAAVLTTSKVIRKTDYQGYILSSSLPNAPSRTGYEFAGWSLDKDGAYIINNIISYRFTEDTTVYAVWSIVAEMVTVKFFDDYDNRIWIKTVQVVKGTTLSEEDFPTEVQIDDVTPPGKVFEKWLKVDTVIFNIYSEFTSDTILTTSRDIFAKWSTIPANPEVTFNANNGQFSNGETTTTITTNSSGICPAPSEPTRDGYVLAGWKLWNGKIIDLGTYTFTKNTTVYAIWQVKKVIFNAGRPVLNRQYITR